MSSRGHKAQTMLHTVYQGIDTGWNQSIPVGAQGTWCAKGTRVMAARTSGIVEFQDGDILIDHSDDHVILIGQSAIIGDRQAERQLGCTADIRCCKHRGGLVGVNECHISS